MSEYERWPISEGYCTIQNGEIEIHKIENKKEKIKKYELADVSVMEKELKHSWVNLKFNVNGRNVKKELSFKQIEDADTFVNAVLKLSPSSKFDDRTESIGIYPAVKKPLAIFGYLAILILGIMAVAYGIVFLMQRFDINSVDVPILLYIPIQIVYAISINKCLIILCIIGALCLLGAAVRLIRRPLARIIARK